MIAIYLHLGRLKTTGVPDALALCKRAQAIGYDTVVGWASEHEAVIEDKGDRARAREFAAGLESLGLRLWVQGAHTGFRVQAALGFEAMEKVTKKDAVCCLADQRVFRLWETWAARVPDWYPGSEGVLLSYDEMRAAGTHGYCKRNNGYGPLLAQHARRAIALHRHSLPKHRVAVWSDMFCPFENAAPGDYVGDYPDHKWCVPGGFKGSHFGLDAGVSIFNWSYDLRSYNFFGRLRHPQVMCGYYDFGQNDWGDGRSPEQEHSLRLVAKAAGYPLDHYLYTTWTADFSRLADYFPHDLQ